MVRHKILHISPDFNYSCGVSKHVFELLKHFNSSEKHKVYFITNGGDALSKLENEHIDFRFLQFSKGFKNIFHFLTNYYQLKSLCVKNKIDIIHTHHRYPELLSTLIAKKINVKTITTVHSLVKGYKNISFRSDRIIAVSNLVKNSIIKNFHIPKNKIELLHNCVIPPDKPNAESVENLRQKLNIGLNDFVILFLGRLNRIKGIDLLIRAFRKIKPEFPNVKLILVGQILDETYKQMKVKSDEDILYLGARADTNSFFELCDIVILPSREDPFPYVMLEAGIANKPFIGSHTGGIEEFIDDGVNGFLFEPGNIDDLADKIKFIIINPEKARSTAEELYKKVIKHCNCEEYYEKLTDAYEKLFIK